jgi:hypothetical protein
MSRIEIADLIARFLAGRPLQPGEWDEFLARPLVDRNLDALRRSIARLPHDYPAARPGRWCGPAGIAILKRTCVDLRRSAAPARAPSPRRRRVKRVLGWTAFMLCVLAGAPVLFVLVHARLLPVGWELHAVAAWAVLSVAAASYASNHRGRNPIVWSIVALVGSPPLAVAVLATLPRRRARRGIGPV